MSAGVRLQRAHGEPTVLVVTIDRPRAANAIDAMVGATFYAALREAAADDGIGAVLLTGAGTRVFSAGADLKNPDGLAPLQLAEQRAAALTSMLDPILSFPKPLVAAVNGVASGAGAMLALLADRVVAADTARFVFPEIDVAMPTLLGLAILSDLGGTALAADLVLSGRSMPAAEAAHRGLVTCVPAAALQGQALLAARALAAKPAAAFALNKAWLQRSRRATIDHAIRETRANRSRMLTCVT